MGKLPAFQFYPGDWRKDMGVQALNYFDRGVWHEMICLMHESERRGVLVLNGNAMTDDMLAQILGLDKQILTTTLTTLLTTGVASRESETGAIMCRRMVRDEKLHQIRASSGILGGNPALLNQKSTTLGGQTATPSSSSSVSSSSSASSSISALTSFKKESPLRSGQNAFLSPAEGVSPEKPMDEAWMIARAVIEGTNITNQWAVDQIAKQAELELKAHPGEMDAIRDGMIGAWNAYQACAKADKLRTAPMGAQKFFGEGIWKKSSMWGMKKGMRAYENST